LFPAKFSISPLHLQTLRESRIVKHCEFGLNFKFYAPPKKQGWVQFPSAPAKEWIPLLQ